MNLKTNNKYKKELVEFFNKQKTKKKEKSHEKRTTSQLKQRISKFKLLKGINAYRKNMKYYFEEEVGSKFDKIIGDMKHNNIKSKKENFAKTLCQTVNHKKALEAVKKDLYIKEEYEYKLI